MTLISSVDERMVFIVSILWNLSRVENLKNTLEYISVEITDTSLIFFVRFHILLMNLELNYNLYGLIEKRNWI